MTRLTMLDELDQARLRHECLKLACEQALAIEGAAAFASNPPDRIDPLALAKRYADFVLGTGDA